MAKTLRKRFRRFLLHLTLTYWLVCAVAWLFLVLPEGLAMWLGRLAGRFAYYADFRHRKLCIDNLGIAFPEKSPGERKALAKACYRHLGQCFAEFCRFPKLHAGNIRDYLDEENLHILQDALKQGHGVVGITGHVGFWEMTGFGAACLGLPLDSVARPLDAPRLNALVDRLRRDQGQRIFPKEGALRHIVRSLKDDRVFGLLMDQYAGRDAIWVPFFGREASTLDTAARLHLKLKAPVVIGTSYRKGTAFRHSMRVRGPLQFHLTGDEQKDIVEITRACNAALEEAIREHPEQWMWQHRRWKPKKIKGAQLASDGSAGPQSAQTPATPGQK